MLELGTRDTNRDYSACFELILAQPRAAALVNCQVKGNSFEGPLACWMSVLRVPSLAGCQFLEGPLTCLDVMWSLFWSKLDLKMKI